MKKRFCTERTDHNHFFDENYKIVKGIDLLEMALYPVFDDEKRAVEIDALRLFKVVSNEEMAVKGMDNQDTVNPYGIALNCMYDEILNPYDEVEAYKDYPDP